MTNEIAVLGVKSIDKLLSSLRSIGYRYGGLLSHKISGYNRQDRVTFHSNVDARHFLASGIWRRRNTALEVPNR